MNIEEVRRMLEKDYKRLKNWRAVAEKYRINPGMAYMIVKKGHEPKDLKIRARLGMKSEALAPVCPKCGVVHVSRRCTARPAMWMRKVWETPTAELRWRLDHREEL